MATYILLDANHKISPKDLLYPIHAFGDSEHVEFLMELSTYHENAFSVRVRIQESKSLKLRTSPLTLLTDTRLLVWV